MAVPTVRLSLPLCLANLSSNSRAFSFCDQIYSRLLDIQASFDASKQEKSKAALSKLRLMVSGSASLPAEIKKRWAAIGGGVLLERFVSFGFSGRKVNRDVKPTPVHSYVLIRQVRDDRNRHDHLVWARPLVACRRELSFSPLFPLASVFSPSSSSMPVLMRKKNRLLDISRATSVTQCQESKFDSSPKRARTSPTSSKLPERFRLREPTSSRDTGTML